MNFYRKASLYTKDFFFQSIVFFVLSISPLGSIGWKIGVFRKSGIEELFINFIDVPIQLILHLVLGFLLSILYTFPFIICNIYLWHFNKFRKGKEDYLPLKILFMLTISGLCISLYAHWFGYNEMLNLDFIFPIVLTTISYVIWSCKLKKKNTLNKTNR